MDESTRDVEYAKLAYADTVQVIASTKQTTWIIVRWTVGSIFAALALKFYKNIQIADWMPYAGILLIGAVGSLALYFVQKDLRNHRGRLASLRDEMGGLMRRIWPDQAELDGVGSIHKHIHTIQRLLIGLVTVCALGLLAVTTHSTPLPNTPPAPPSVKSFQKNLR